MDFYVPDQQNVDKTASEILKLSKLSPKYRNDDSMLRDIKSLIVDFYCNEYFFELFVAQKISPDCYEEVIRNPINNIWKQNFIHYFYGIVGYLSSDLSHRNRIKDMNRIDVFEYPLFKIVLVLWGIDDIYKMEQQLIRCYHTFIDDCRNTCDLLADMFVQELPIYYDTNQKRKL